MSSDQISDLYRRLQALRDTPSRRALGLRMDSISSMTLRSLEDNSLLGSSRYSDILDMSLGYRRSSMLDQVSTDSMSSMTFRSPDVTSLLGNSPYSDVLNMRLGYRHSSILDMDESYLEDDDKDVFDMILQQRGSRMAHRMSILDNLQRRYASPVSVEREQGDISQGKGKERAVELETVQLSSISPVADREARLQALQNQLQEYERRLEALATDTPASPSATRQSHQDLRMEVYQTLSKCKSLGEELGIDRRNCDPESSATAERRNRCREVQQRLSAILRTCQDRILGVHEKGEDEVTGVHEKKEEGIHKLTAKIAQEYTATITENTVVDPLSVEAQSLLADALAEELSSDSACPLSQESGASKRERELLDVEESESPPKRIQLARSLQSRLSLRNWPRILRRRTGMG